MIKFIGTILICLAILGIVGPIASCWIANEIASCLGSNITGSGPEIVMYRGFDIGGVLYEMGMMPWLLLLTAPISVLLFPVGLALRYVTYEN
jgi:hypothetical protein